MITKIFPVLLAAGLPLLASCVAPSGASKRTVNAFLANKQYAQAEAYLETAKQTQYGQRNMVLFYLDKGLVQHHAGKYKESDASLDLAEKRMDELYTKSVTKAAGMLVVNDTTMDYAGEPFERALTNVFRAMNWVMMGSNEEALVESRKVERFLTELGDKVGGKLAYKDDAFARYLDALLYADAGKMDDARISYQAAQAAYEDYASLYGTTMPKFEFEKTKAKRGEIVFIHYNGVAPRKVVKTFQIAWGNALATVQSSDDAEAQNQKVKNALAAGFTGNAITVAFPNYVQDPFQIASSEILIDGKPASQTQLAENISAIAQKNLEQRMAGIKARAIARATVKYILAETAAKAAAQLCDRQYSRGSWQNLLCKGATKGLSHGLAAASETADTRAWAVLPAQIRLARVKAEPGAHEIGVIYKNAAGVMVSSQTFSGVMVADKRRTYLSARTAQ